MKALPGADRDLKLWILLNQADTALLNSTDDELRPYGLTAMQSVVLFVVQAIGNKATPTEISRWLLRKPHSVSGLLDRMEKIGLVKKTNDADRKNVIRVTLTAKGKQVYKQSLKKESIRRALSSLSDKECQVLESVLKSIRDAALEKPPLKQNLPFP